MTYAGRRGGGGVMNQILHYLHWKLIKNLYICWIVAFHNHEKYRQHNIELLYLQSNYKKQKSDVLDNPVGYRIWLPNFWPIPGKAGYQAKYKVGLFLIEARSLLLLENISTQLIKTKNITFSWGNYTHAYFLKPFFVI